MKFNLLLVKELKLLMRQKLTLFALLIFYLVTAAGMNAINNSNELMLHGIKRSTMTIAYGTAQYGGMVGILLFSLIAVLALSKDRRKQSMELMETSLSYSGILIARVLAVLLLGCFAVFSSILLIMGVQKLACEITPDLLLYLYIYIMLALLPILIAVLISSGMYLIWQSVDISILITVALFGLGITGKHYLLVWSKPWAPVFSDFAGIKPIGKLMLYNRLLWGSIAGCALILGVLCKRKYDFSIWGSLRHHSKKIYLPIVGILMMALATGLVLKEPYMTKTSMNVSQKEKSQTGIFLKEMDSKVSLLTVKSKMMGEAKYLFKNEEKKDILEFLINEGLMIHNIYVNGKLVTYQRKNTECIKIHIPKEEKIEIKINYSGSIKYHAPMGMAGYIDKESVYLLENANWLPTPLTENKERIKITGVIHAPKELCVIIPGRLLKEEVEGEEKIWSYGLEASSVSLGIFAGKYQKAQFEVDGLSAEFYYSPKHEDYIKDREIIAYMEKMLGYYVSTFGDYPEKDYPLKIVETSIYKPGGHSSINVVTLAEYIFNRETEGSGMQLVYDYGLIHDLEIIAHEIAHQWWGTGVMAKLETPWSEEGLAVYSAYKFIEEEFGEEKALSICSLWDYEVTKVQNSYYGKHPEEAKSLSKGFQDQIEAEKLHMALYSQMPAMLLQAERQLGEKHFLERLAKVYQKYIHRELSYSVFLEEMRLTEEVMKGE